MTGKISRAAFRPGDFKLHSGAPDSLPAGWTLADHRIADIADFPRLYGAVGQAWRLGGDVFDIGLQFRIPDGTRLFRGATWAAGGPAAFAYPLDDDGTLATAFGVSLLPMDAPGQQTFSFVNLADFATYVAMPAGAFIAANFPRPAAVPIAVQYSVPTATLPATSAARYGAPMVVVISDVGAVVGSAYVRLTGYSEAAIALGFGGYGELVVNDVPGAQTGFATTIVGKSAAIYVNADGSIGYTVAGVDVGAIPGLTVGATDRVFFMLRHDDPAGGGGLGVTFSGALLTGAADITEPVPAGTTDPFGNVVGEAAPATSDVGTRAGSATSGGHVLTLAELPSDALDGGYQGAGTDGSGGAGLGDGRDFIDTAVPLTLGGSDAAHDHTIDPEHVKVLVLVKT